MQKITQGRSQQLDWLGSSSLHHLFRNAGWPRIGRNYNKVSQFQIERVNSSMLQTLVSYWRDEWYEAYNLRVSSPRRLFERGVIAIEGPRGGCQSKPRDELCLGIGYQTCLVRRNLSLPFDSCIHIPSRYPIRPYGSKIFNNENSKGVKH